MRDNDESRKAANGVARDYMDKAKRAGNTTYTFQEARARVGEALNRGDHNRSNKNR
ncbi:MAG: hypothetical protein HRU00_12345 [Myxococcales bacterium]|nr:hypothetical protein [Myxococcales bacterium]